MGFARRLVAVMFTDLVGYSALSRANERLALELLEEQKTLLRDAFATWGGREIKCTGDGFFVEFPSISDCLRCAMEIQARVSERNAGQPEGRRFHVRIGTHVGDLYRTDAGDWHGDSVNIAARIEGVAEPGGVCVTETVVQMTRGETDLRFRKVGRRALKNIADAPILYRLVFPHEHRSEGRGFRTKLRAALDSISLFSPRQALSWIPLAAIAISALLLFVVASQRVLAKVGAYYENSLGSDEPLDPEIRLDSGWQYATPDPELGPTQVSGLPDSSWRPFDTGHTAQYADILHGRYWLRKRFHAANLPQRPAMVLGMFQESHRAYLNGSFIGGSSYLKPVQHYAFDRALLRKGARNEILVQVSTASPTNMPGLTIRNNMRPAITEFEAVESATNREKLIFFDLRNLYFFPAFFLSILGFAYFILQRRETLFFYFPLYIFVSSLTLFYYNPVVTNLLDHSLFRYLKLYSISASSFILVSMYLRNRGLRKVEWVNNGAAVAFLASVYWIRGRTETAAELMKLYESALLFVAIYLGVATAAMVAHVILRTIRRPRGFDPGVREVYDLTLAGFSVVASLVILSSAAPKVGPHFFPKQVQFLLNDLGVGYPYLFCLLIFAAAVWDYARTSREARCAEVREQFLLTVSSVVDRDTPVSDRLRELQILVCGYLSARRSTLYVVDSLKNPSCLQLRSAFVEPGIAARIAPTASLREGVLGWIMDHDAPVLAKDIRRDPRFAGFISTRPGGTHYHTGSCILVPLHVGGRVAGVFTVSERSRGETFTNEDFAVLKTLSREISLQLHELVFQDQRPDQESQAAV